MIALVTGIVTALATTIAAIFMWMEWKLKTTPYITAESKSAEQGGRAVTVRIHPAQAPIRFVQIRAKDAMLAVADISDIDIETGVQKWKPAHDPLPGSLPLDVALPPQRVSGQEKTLIFWIKSNNSARSLRICMVARHKYFNVKHWITI